MFSTVQSFAFQARATARHYAGHDVATELRFGERTSVGSSFGCPEAQLKRIVKSRDRPNPRAEPHNESVETAPAN